ncbi:histidine phosphatase family protein [Sphingopyxis bauzanensis]|uniref:phosphoglycerate mutase (2,3-diphosphoglycerate-dependent) n=1 Tax=Sphingopyxis bauzanensis TaxID=651663 RepID=A0A246JVC0_9SPHN|nr:histidine phosphatase family protein [Sphingopyxis bauzanensis]
MAYPERWRAVIAATGPLFPRAPHPGRCNRTGHPALTRNDNSPPFAVTPRWPATLWIVRHGQSPGNVARDAADEAGAHRISLDHRDVDVPLSALGQAQAAALGEWFAGVTEQQRPEIILPSPYVRAIETAEIFRASGGCPPHVGICHDERLREKEFGILDGLTRTGIAAAHPDQAAFRQLLGKFYHRPPGGESWCDVILRLRSLLDTVSLHYGGRRVMIIAHQVVVLCLRTIIENLSEREILAIDQAGDVANCAITEYRLAGDAHGEGHLELERYNVTAPTAEPIPVTRAPDVMVAARG